MIYIFIYYIRGMLLANHTHGSAFYTSIAPNEIRNAVTQYAGRYTRTWVQLKVIRRKYGLV